MTDEKLTAQLSQLEKATNRLEEVLQIEPTEFNKDAAIQRFEFTFELAWKTLKTIIELKGRETNSPKDCFRIAVQLNLISDPLPWFEFLKNRNYASHTYNQQLANYVYSQLKSFLPLVQNLLTKLKSET